MKVLKFGGTSVGSAKNIKSVINIVKNNPTSEKQLIVVSAFSGVTNLLLDGIQHILNSKDSFDTISAKIVNIHLNVINELIVEESVKGTIFKYLHSELDKLKQLYQGISLIKELTPKATAKIVSFGEIVSSFIITEAMVANELKAERKDARELIITNSNYSNAIVDFKHTNENIQEFVTNSASDVLIIPGFVAANKEKETTVLGRGGSDYTAAVIAAALDVNALEIWTDVSGMYTANPKIVKQAKPIPQISYEEAMELAHFGAKVIFSPTIHPAFKKEIPIYIKNTFEPTHVGTLITNKPNENQSPVKGISHIENVTLITLEAPGMIGVPGVSKKVFETLFLHDIHVKLVTQSSSEHSICIGIDDIDAAKAKEVIDSLFELEISKEQINPLIVEIDLVIIALVGENMKSHQGISGKMFSTLGKNNVNIRAIAQGASERNITAVILKDDVKKALNSLHEEFFEDNIKQVNIFITGVGNVGGKLINQIHQQKNYLKKNLNINVRVVGLSNSRTMTFNESGIDLKHWQDELARGENASLDGFHKKVIELNLRNSVFVDITANAAVANLYQNYLKNSIGVVACNKIACSASLENYKELKRLSKKYDAPLLFETNVGAGLPVIDTLNNLIASGDSINNIQAVLSGSLNFVFNNFNNSVSFYDIVKQAQKEGYTEPDPRIDLSGIDVARKILILARECGNDIELDAIKNDSFLTKGNLAADTVDDFYESLKADEKHFQKLYASAKSNSCQLKYVAQFNNGKASVGLKEIPAGHPFYNLEGKDNIVMFYTERYPEQPLIIKGAGAGADVTASGLFADIIKTANY
jgi:aspartokinase/homoserine dehydrogenase 1